MITRRNFLKSASITTVASSVPADVNAAVERSPEVGIRQPLRAEPRRRIIFMKPAPLGGMRLFSDAAPEPRPLIRTEALEKAFGLGVGQSLHQPDHWRMIDEGWFRGDELYELNNPNSHEYAVWQANYHPECEAHDLLHGLFGSGLLPGGGVRKDVGLAFSEQPCTPRFATVTLLDAYRSPELKARVSGVSEWLSIQIGGGPENADQ